MVNVTQNAIAPKTPLVKDNSVLWGWWVGEGKGTSCYSILPFVVTRGPTSVLTLTAQLDYFLPHILDMVTPLWTVHSKVVLGPI